MSRKFSYKLPATFVRRFFSHPLSLLQRKNFISIF